jgi:ketosteroid isomerase-like protein
MSVRSVLLAALALALGSTACQPPAQEAGPLSEADVAAIRQLAEADVQAALANDWTTWAGYHTEDVLFMPPNLPAIEGRAALEEWLGPVRVIEFTRELVDIDGRDGLAYARGTHSIMYTPEGAPEPVSEAGKWVWILRKQADGSWRIAVHIWNLDHPPSE